MIVGMTPVTAATATTSRARRVVVAAALSAVLLSGCGAAEDAVQGAQDAAAEQASQAAQSAKDAAASKAADLAADAVRSQVCTLVEDGRLSAADAKALDRLAPVAKDAGVPDELLDLVRAVAEEGTSASKGEVSDLKAAACA